MSTFVTILAVFLTYTVLKGAWLWPAHPGLGAVIAVPYFALMLAWQFAYRARQESADTLWFRALAGLGSFLLGTWASFIFLSLPVDVARLLHALDRASGLNLTASVGASWPSADRFYLWILKMSALIAVLGQITVRQGPSVRRVPIKIPGLPAELAGLRIAQISDLHVGPTVRTSYVERVVRRTNDLAADLVVVTGDLADANAPAIRDQLAPLAGLKSRHGVFYVTGNHEYYWDTDGLVGRARELGLQPLINENRVVSHGGRRILIAGVTDPMGAVKGGVHVPDLRRAAAGPAADLRLLLAHRPDVALEAGPLGFDLQMSGHTHGGQFFPFSLIISFFHRYARGLDQNGRMWVYVNPGTGYWGPVNRFANPAEITAFTLQ